MKNRLLILSTLIVSSMFLLNGCSESDSFEESDSSGEDDGETVANSGVISQKNFSLLTADVAPVVIDGTTGIFTKTDVELTVFIGDRNNQVLTDAHTIQFVAEYGLVEPSCVTENGTCSVTWSAIKRPDAGGPGSDGVVTITAYTKGEEGFTDLNGTNVFDDGDTDFDDLEEPFIDADESNGTFTTGDIIIDVKSTNDPSGDNKEHDIADGFYNGKDCKHSSLCGDKTSITIFDSVSMSFISDPAAIPTFTIGGSLTFMNASTGQTLIIQNNAGDDLTLNDTETTYTFATALNDGDTYEVTIDTAPTGLDVTCTFDNGNDMDTVSGANITDVDITCQP